MNRDIQDKMVELVEEFKKDQLQDMSTIAWEVDGGDNTINGESYLIYIEWDDKNKENDEENIIHLVNGVKKTKSKVLNIIQNLANKVFKETECKNFTISYKINGRMGF
jgi:hypothetical protein